MSRPLTTTTANGPYSAPGTGLHALDFQLINNPPDNAAYVLPAIGSSPKSGEPDATAYLLRAVAFFIPKVDHLAHRQSPESNSVNLQVQNCMGGSAWSDKSLVEIQQKA